MKHLLPAQFWPLLAKELREQSSRRRLYTQRALYALGLAGCFFLFVTYLPGNLGAGPAQMLGGGEVVLRALLLVQFVTICLVLPASMAGAIAYERECGTLDLLRLTGLRAHEILLQKYVGRLIPMFTMLLASMPLLALAYSLGGFSTASLWCGVLFLFLACLHVGALAILVSAVCDSLLTAWIGAYLAGALFYGVPLALSLVKPLVPTRGTALPWNEAMLLVLVPVPGLGGTDASSPRLLLLRSIPVLISTLLFLWLAWRAVAAPRAAGPRRRNPFLHVWGFLNAEAALVPVKSRLPRTEPVAWLEENKRTFSKTQDLIRLFLFLAFPLLVAEFPLELAQTALQRSGHSATMAALGGLLFVLAVLAVCASAVTTVLEERSRQTLDVLLVTPLSGRDIVRQKMHGTWRLACVFYAGLCLLLLIEARGEMSRARFVTFLRVVPLPLALVIVGLVTWLGILAWRRIPVGRTWRALGVAALFPGLLLADAWAGRAPFYAPCVTDWWAAGGLDALLGTLLVGVVTVPMFAWVAMWIGLNVRNRQHAVVSILTVLVAWNTLPWLAGWAFLPVLLAIPNGWSYVGGWQPAFHSPLAWLALTDMGQAGRITAPLFLGLLVWHTAILLFFRRMCLVHADRYLGRIPRPDKPPQDLR